MTHATPEQLPGEEWRPVPGFRNYMVSSLGRVWSRPRPKSNVEFLRPQRSGRYRKITLADGPRRQRYDVHVLVAAVFLGPRPEGQQVRHLNGDAHDCRAVNLAYGTPGQNILDQVTHGRHPWANKTHCPQGHPYDETNTRRIPSKPNARYCRACGREATAKYYRRKREQVAA